MNEQAIYGSIIGVMSEIGAINKAKKNQQQGFMYRGIDDVMNTLQPLLVKHGVFVVPEVMEQTREERTTKTGGNLIYSICRIKFTFFANDGSSITAVIIGEGMDSGDKATNKAMAIAFKYACFQVFCIPTEEIKDPDGQTHPPSVPTIPDVISREQRERLLQLAAGDVDLVTAVVKSFGYEKSKQIKKIEYDEVCAKITSIVKPHDQFGQDMNFLDDTDGAKLPFDKGE